MQVNWHDPTAHVQRFFPPKVQKQTTVTLLYDVTDVLLMYGGEGVKGSAHKTEGLSGAGSWFGSAVWLVPKLFHLGSHRPSTSATSVPLEEWNYNQTGNVLYLFNHMYLRLSWVL